MEAYVGLHGGSYAAHGSAWRAQQGPRGLMGDHGSRLGDTWQIVQAWGGVHVGAMRIMADDGRRLGGPWHIMQAPDGIHVPAMGEHVK